MDGDIQGFDAVGFCHVTRHSTRFLLTPTWMYDVTSNEAEARDEDERIQSQTLEAGLSAGPA